MADHELAETTANITARNLDFFSFFFLNVSALLKSDLHRERQNDSIVYTLAIKPVRTSVSCGQSL